MPPRPAKKAKKSTKKKVVEDEVSENLQDDDELLNMDNANQPGNEQEDLTQEQKEENIYKKLTSNNPQAPLNVTKFSYKERLFKTEDVVEQLVFHYSCDGDILVLESDEARD
jgi:dynein intermediate chain 1